MNKGITEVALTWRVKVSKLVLRSTLLFTERCNTLIYIQTRYAKGDFYQFYH